MGGGRSDKLRHKEWRKLRRASERAKKKTEGKKAAPLQHDDHRLESLISGLKTRIRKSESGLRAYQDKVEETHQDKRLKLYGAARPAHEVYPELYPELATQEEEEDEGRDLLAEASPNCFLHAETRPLLGLKVSLLCNMLHHAIEAKTPSLASEVRKTFDGIKEMDEQDTFNTRFLFMSAYLYFSWSRKSQGKAALDEWRTCVGLGDDDRLYKCEIAFHQALSSFLIHGRSDQVKHAMDCAVTTCREIALVLLNDAAMSTAVDDHVVLDETRKEREKRIQNSCDEGKADCLIVRCDGGLCRNQQGFAVAFRASFGKVWHSHPEAVELLRESLASDLHRDDDAVARASSANAPAGSREMDQYYRDASRRFS